MMEGEGGLLTFYFELWLAHVHIHKHIKFNLKMSMRASMAAHIFNASAWEPEARGLCDYAASLVYRVSKKGSGV